ncbi:MAG: 30S ribosomal protein S3 [bacterium]
MGQKVHPRGLRLGIISTWDSRWYAEKEEYTENLHEDLMLRDAVMKWNFRNERKGAGIRALRRQERENMRFSGISKIEIERKGKNITIFVSTARPGIVIGRSGETIEALTSRLRTLTGKNVDIKIRPIDNPDLDAFLVGESVAQMLERRFGVRRAVRQSVERVMRSGAKGVRICVSGRLGGAEIARTEWTRRGRVPLHTLRADIDYAVAEAYTTYGKIGIKVWIYKGDQPTDRRSHAAGQFG